MYALQSLSIRYKILLIVIISFVGFSAYFAINFYVANNNAKQLNLLHNSIYPTLEKSEKNIVTLNQVTNLLDQAVTTDEEDEIENAQIEVEKIQASLNDIKQLSPSKESEIKSIEQSLMAYFSHASKLTKTIIEGNKKPETLSNSIQEMQVKLKTIKKKLKDFRDKKHQAFIKTIVEANASAQYSLTMGGIIGIILMSILAFTGYMISSRIASAIINVSVNLQNIASGDGDLTLRLPSKCNDEVGDLVVHFNTFMGKLQKIIQELKEHSNHVESSAENLAHIAQLSHDDMQQQRTDTDHVSTASNEMAATVAEVTKNASQAAEAAEAANTAANNGNNVVNDTINIINSLANEVDKGAVAVSKLKQDSENVGTVLDVIRGIAEQTNLLALNAAIEAARAGEQGRGFAVVADEVRTLASRTQESTEEIQTMIESLQSSAEQASSIMTLSKTTSEEGVTKAANAGKALQEISDAVVVINEMNTQIANATVEQSSVAHSMDENIISISLATEKNTESSNQLANAGTDLTDIAVKLQNVVGQFKV